VLARLASPDPARGADARASRPPDGSDHGSGDRDGGTHAGGLTDLSHAGSAS
jgi:hypothetical protein